jgi:hypothetical protein
MDPLTILYTLVGPLPLQHVYTCLHINIKHRSTANISLAPVIPEVPICERLCHVQRKTEIKPRTTINNMDSRQINIFCEIFKICNVFFLCSSYIPFHMLFNWKKTEQIVKRTPGVRGPPFEKRCCRLSISLSSTQTEFGFQCKFSSGVVLVTTKHMADTLVKKTL